MAKISTAEAREHFSEVVNQTAYGKERTVLTRRGKEIAAIVPIEDYRRLEDLAFQQALEQGNQQYGRMLKNLAE